MSRETKGEPHEGRTICPRGTGSTGEVGEAGNTYRLEGRCPTLLGFCDLSILGRKRRGRFPGGNIAVMRVYVRVKAGEGL